MLIKLPPEFNGEVAIPAANQKLDKMMAQLAHHNIAKLIFPSQRARPDIQTSVAFLSTRATRDMLLTLKSDDLDHMC
eukprot:8782195-Ditylum_brightwellii.AAC.1